MSKLDTLAAALQAALGGQIQSLKTEFGEITVTVAAADYIVAATTLRDDPSLRFEQLIDLCGLDYSSYKDGGYDGMRYAVATQLLSITHNWRVRLKVFCPDDDLPLVMAQKRVIYQAVTIEPREITPRIIREANYGGI